MIRPARFEGIRDTYKHLCNFKIADTYYLPQCLLLFVAMEYNMKDSAFIPPL